MSWVETYYIEEFTRENDMYGYVFIVTNLNNGMKFIGANLSVVFDNKYFGYNPKLLYDVEKQGTADFSCKMLMPYESKAGVEWGLQKYIEEYSALTDPSFYNYEGSKNSKAEDADDKPKSSRTRKKKADEG